MGGNVDAAGSLVGGDGDGLAVAQGDGHRRLRGVGQGGGVNDLAAFGHAWRCRQRDRGGVLHVSDAGADLGFVSHQILEVAASDVADAVGDGRMVLIDIVADGAGGSPRALADRDGDALAIGQGHHDRAAGDRGTDGGGVEDGPTLGYGRRGGQRHCGGVLNIGDRGADRGGIGDQVFIVAAANGRDVVGDRGMALVDIVAGDFSGGAGTLAHRDGDALPVGQGDHYCRTGDRCGDRCGVDDAAAFGHRWRGSQAHGRGVDGIGDVGHRWGAVDCEVLEVAAQCIGDTGADLAGVEVGIIAVGGDADAARGLVGGDGDGLPIAQGDGYRGLRGIGQGGGVHDLSTFGHARGRRQRHGGGVLHVSDAGADRRFVSHQVFVIATGHVADAVGDGGMALIDVVADGTGGRARALADWDGDALAIGQRDHHRTAGDRGTDGSGVENGAAFGHRWRRGEAHGRGVDGIGDVGHRWGAVDCEVLEVAARCIGDTGADLAGVEVGIIAVRGNTDAARGLVSGDGDGLAIAQGDGHRRLRSVGQGGGVHDLSTFGHARRRRQRDGGGVLHVCDAGADGGLIGDQILVVAAADTGDAVGNGRVPLIDIVGHGAGGRTGALADCNGDDLPVRQVDHDRATGDGCVDSGGVEDGPALGHRRRGRQCNGGGVLNIGHRGADSRLVRHQVFVIATGHVADAVGDGGMALVNVVADGARGSSRALADGDGDALAIGQGHHDRAAGNGGTHGGGVEDGAAFGHGWRGRQGDRGGVRHIADAGADLGLVGHQVFIVSARHIADAVADGRMALVDVIGDCSGDGSGTLPDRDGDGLAVGQSDHNGRTGDRCGDRGGVDDGAAFGHRWRSSQADSRGINGIGDVGHRWSGIDRQVFEIASAGVGDARTDLAGIEVGVIAVGGNADAAGGLVGGDGDGLAVAQGDGHWRLGGIGEGGGVHDLSTFGHARRRRQRDGGGVLHVCDTGADGGLIGD